MKNQALFSSNDKSKKLKCRLLQFLFGALRINGEIMQTSLSAHCIYMYGVYISLINIHILRK